MASEGQRKKGTNRPHESLKPSSLDAELEIQIQHYSSLGGVRVGPADTQQVRHETSQSGSFWIDRRHSSVAPQSVNPA